MTRLDESHVQGLEVSTTQGRRASRRSQLLPYCCAAMLAGRLFRPHRCSCASCDPARPVLAPGMALEWLITPNACPPCANRGWPSVSWWTAKHALRIALTVLSVHRSFVRPSWGSSVRSKISVKLLSEGRAKLCPIRTSARVRGRDVGELTRFPPDCNGDYK